MLRLRIIICIKKWLKKSLKLLVLFAIILYIYICMYTYTYVYMRVYLCIYTHIFVCIFSLHKILLHFIFKLLEIRKLLTNVIPKMFLLLNLESQKLKIWKQSSRSEFSKLSSKERYIGEVLIVCMCKKRSLVRLLWETLLLLLPL